MVFDVGISTSQLRELFNVFDVGRKGTIDITELRSAFRSLGIHHSIDEINRSLKTIRGESKTRHITFDLFCMLVEKELPAINTIAAYKQVFAMFCGDEKGFITLPMLKELCDDVNARIPDEQLQQMIDCADSNGDGSVSFNDFLRIVQSG